MDPNHDIVPTLRMFDGLMTGRAADEIERLRGIQTGVDLNIRRARAFYFRLNPPNTTLAIIFNALLKANGTLDLPEEEIQRREKAAQAGLLEVAPGRSVSKAIGRCGDCVHRDATGYCTSEKLAEDLGHRDEERADMLIYDYTEGGGFWVGEKFGCVHHAPNAELTRGAALTETCDA